MLGRFVSGCLPLVNVREISLWNPVSGCLALVIVDFRLVVYELISSFAVAVLRSDSVQKPPGDQPVASFMSNFSWPLVMPSGFGINTKPDNFQL